MDPTYTVFDGNRRLARGSLFEVSVAARKRLDTDATAAILIFDDRCGETVDVDLRGTVESVDGEFCAFRLADGTRLVGRNVGGAKAGVPAVACIRPERMKLASGIAGAAGQNGNTLAGEVTTNEADRLP